MGHTAEKPRQTAQQFRATDSQARAQGGTTSTKPAKPCENNPWKLTVKASGVVNTRKLQLDDAKISVEWSDAFPENLAHTAESASAIVATPIQRSGAATGRCSAAAKGWYLESVGEVSLADGDDKTVELVLKPAVWVGFKVVDHASNALIGDMKLRANVAEIGEQTATSNKVQPLEFEHDSLRPGGTCELLELGHDQFVWEVVGDMVSR